MEAAEKNKNQSDERCATTDCDIEAMAAKEICWVECNS